jgi:hypothetical protein
MINPNWLVSVGRVATAGAILILPYASTSINESLQCVQQQSNPSNQPALTTSSSLSSPAVTPSIEPQPAEVIVVQQPSPDPYSTFFIAGCVAYVAWLSERSLSRRNSLELQIVESQLWRQRFERKQERDSDRLQKQIHELTERLDTQLSESGLQSDEKRTEAQRKYEEMMRQPKGTEERGATETPDKTD